jgi:hypothetical protein
MSLRKATASSELGGLLTRRAEERRIESSKQKLTSVRAEEIAHQCIRHITAVQWQIRGDAELVELGIMSENQVRELRDVLVQHPQKGVGSHGYKLDPEYVQTLNTRSKVADLISILMLHSEPADPKGQTPPADISLGRIENTLSNLQDEWNTFTFEFHETEGLLPLSRTVSLLRAHAGVLSPATYQTAAAEVMEPRYVNSSLWSATDDEPLDQRTARLIVGEIYHLGIQIGPKDTRVRTVGATALVEEIFNWTPEMSGAWVEIGVTGLDFTVIGDPVQELWVPRKVSSDFIYFAVSPQVAGVARLRFCLYHKQNLIQSFRLAAITQDKETPEERNRARAYLLAEAAGFPEGRAEDFWYQAERELRESLEERTRLRAYLLAEAAGFPEGRAEDFWYRAHRLVNLARALDVPEDKVWDVGYLPRLEYSLATSFESVENSPARALSILANDSNGKAVLTVKGAGTFGVRIPGDIRDYVRKTRQTLKEISYNEVPGAPPSEWPYAFGAYASQPETLKAALLKLAKVGWRLFNLLIPQSEWEKVRSNLKTDRNVNADRKIIHIGQLLLEKVIPWAVIYDHKFDGRAAENNDVCLAALPASDGSLPGDECGTLAACLLHKEQIAKRSSSGGPKLLPETIVCPLHFWGFKHIIEIPPQQVRDSQNGGHEQRDRILSVGKSQLVAGVNAQLRLWSRAHSGELEELTKSGKALWKAKATLRADILQALAAADLDLIYLYCHARGGDDDPGIDYPYLEFKDVPQERIEPEDLGPVQWPHYPLVFLNGCGTVGYSPDALSFFITKMVEDLLAAGVVGTEVTVSEELATKFAKSFLEKFISGATAGDAMLETRRALLAQHNPLGLVYTLYAAAQLAFDRTAAA